MLYIISLKNSNAFIFRFIDSCDYWHNIRCTHWRCYVGCGILRPKKVRQHFCRLIIRPNQATINRTCYTNATSDFFIFPQEKESQGWWARHKGPQVTPTEYGLHNRSGQSIPGEVTTLRPWLRLHPCVAGSQVPPPPRQSGWTVLCQRSVGPGRHPQRSGSGASNQAGLWEAWGLHRGGETRG